MAHQIIILKAPKHCHPTVVWPPIKLSPVLSPNQAFPQEVWEEILPSKANILAVKCQNHITLIVSNSRILFFQVWFYGDS